MQQQSEEWFELRKNKIGASDAPIIMGVSPWKNIKTLWEEKVGLKELEPSNFHQARGLILEEEAREYFFLMTGYKVKPEICFSDCYEWMMASVDGICENKKILLEIKCPGKKDHDLALKGIIPDKYYPQLQHQLEVLNLNQGYYLSFDGEEGNIIKFERNQDYINQLIEKEKKFYECIQLFSPPVEESTIDPKWVNTAFLLKEVHRKQKELTLQEIMLKNTLIDLAKGKNTSACGVTLTKYTRKGGIDYSRLLGDLTISENIDIEKYRREQIENWKFSFH